MTMQQIDNPSIFIKPSLGLRVYIQGLETDPSMPSGVTGIRKGESVGNARPPSDHKYLLSDKDRAFLNDLNSEDAVDVILKPEELRTQEDDQLLNLEDLHWLHNVINASNKTSVKKTYLHELFEGSEVMLPKNVEVPRNPELERRCKILKAQQQNMQYKAMTKNVDCVRQAHPEDTIAYQMKQLNRHLIAVAQFIISVAAGFAFGFIGVELLVGNLDFGFRILLGIICALIIALAELYFLAKKLNEDLNYEATIKVNSKTSKIN